MKLATVVMLYLGFAANVSATDAVELAEGRQPRLVRGQHKNVYCVFGSGHQIRCACSEDGGVSFSKPSEVATLPGLMLGKRRGPRVAVAGHSVVVSAISSDDGDLRAWHSSDGGKSWSAASRVNDVGRSCREGLHDMAAADDGTVAAVWLDLRNRGTELWCSASRDGGVTWETNRLVYRSPDGSICECCHPTITANGGTWSILWRNSLAGQRDLFVATSHDALHNFGEAQRLGDESWRLAACPMDGGDLADGPEGTWAAWRREKVCYATNHKNPARELKLGQGEQPTVAVTSAGPTFAWITARPGELMLLGPGKASPSRIAAQASDPDLISLPDGTVLCAFESIEHGKVVLRVTRLPE